MYVRRLIVINLIESELSGVRDSTDADGGQPQTSATEWFDFRDSGSCLKERRVELARALASPALITENNGR